MFASVRSPLVHAGSAHWLFVVPHNKPCLPTFRAVDGSLKFFGRVFFLFVLEEHYPGRKLAAWLCEIGQHKGRKA